MPEKSRIQRLSDRGRAVSTSASATRARSWRTVGFSTVLIVVAAVTLYQAADTVRAGQRRVSQAPSAGASVQKLARPAPGYDATQPKTNEGATDAFAQTVLIRQPAVACACASRPDGNDLEALPGIL